MRGAGMPHFVSAARGMAIHTARSYGIGCKPALQGIAMTSPEDVPPQTTCPECRGDNLYTHGGISARGGYGPDLLPGASGIFASAKMRSVVCRDCGLVRFYAGNEALARITPENGWRKIR